MQRSLSSFLIAVALIGIAVPSSRCVASCHDVVHFDLAGCPDEHGEAPTEETPADEAPTDDVQHVSDGAELSSRTVVVAVMPPAPLDLDVAPPPTSEAEAVAPEPVAPEIAPPISVLRL